MRLQLTALLALVPLALAAAPPRATAAAPPLKVSAPELRVRTDVYSDPWLTAISPSTRATLRVGEHLEVAVGVQADVISGATQALVTDVVTGATPFEEVRYEAHLGATWRPGEGGDLGVAYLVSLEPDYETHVVSLTGGVELFGRQVRLGLGYGLSLETLGSVHDPTLAAPTVGHSLDVSWAHLLNRGTALTALLTLGYSACDDVRGCQASSYRWVGLAAGGAGRTVLAVRERHPDERLRVAAALRLIQDLGAGVALHAGYRFYADTWGLEGHTADLALARGFWAERLVARLDARFARQSAANFFRSRYDVAAAAPMIPAYRTGDRELSGVWSGSLGLSLEWSFGAVGPFGVLRVSAQAARHWYRYPDFPSQEQRDAWTFGGGIDASL